MWAFPKKITTAIIRLNIGAQYFKENAHRIADAGIVVDHGKSVTMEAFSIVWVRRLIVNRSRFHFTLSTIWAKIRSALPAQGCIIKVLHLCLSSGACALIYVKADRTLETGEKSALLFDFGMNLSWKREAKHRASSGIIVGV